MINHASHNSDNDTTREQHILEDITSGADYTFHIMTIHFNVSQNQSTEDEEDCGTFLFCNSTETSRIFFRIMLQPRAHFDAVK
jgi:hypothetical protein